MAAGTSTPIYAQPFPDTDFFVARLPAPNPPLDGERTSTPLPPGDFIRRATEVIPDGNSIVCAPNDSSEREIHLPSDPTSVRGNLEDDAPIAQWSCGFLLGRQWLEELWEETVPEELDDELGSILMTLSFFSSREIAEAFHGEAATGGQRWTLKFGQLAKVESRPRKRSLECHGRDGVIPLS